MPAADLPLLVVGDRLDRFVVGEPAQFGTTGAWHALDGRDGPTVLLRAWPRSVRDEDSVRHEAEILRRLDHPAIPQLVEVGVDTYREITWIATSARFGDPLSDRLREGAMDWRDATTAFYELAQAVVHLHQNGIAHRDLSPPNVYLTQSYGVQLAGFELAMDENELLAVGEGEVGDLAYVAPEAIADPSAHGPRADLYALGVLFYEALSGRTAFPAATIAGKADVTQRLFEWKTRSSALDPGDDVPPWLAHLIRTSTHPVPEKRLPDVEAFLGWLEAAQFAWGRTAHKPVGDRGRTGGTNPTAPPRIAMEPLTLPAQPSFRPPPSRLPDTDPDLTPVAPPPFALAYLASGVLGLVTALAFSMLVILAVEVATR